ncbi:8427_t:CDS:1, partial [Gigaspora rosea]
INDHYYVYALFALEDCMKLSIWVTEVAPESTNFKLQARHQYAIRLP